MNSNRILTVINQIEKDIVYVKSVEKGDYTQKILTESFEIVNSLKKEIIESPNNISVQTLKKTKILGMYAFKVFENSPLETSIDLLIETLWNEIPIYKEL